jgi:predicted phosphoribosyltransferase
MGAIATGGVRVLNDQTVRALRISDQVIEAVAAKEQRELGRRARLYRGDRPPPDLRGKTVILVWTTAWRPGLRCLPPLTRCASSRQDASL